MSTGTASSPPAGVNFRRGGPLRRAVFSNLWRTLSIVLSVMQVLLLQWALVVLLDGEGLGFAFGVVLAGALVGVNLWVLPVVRRARMRGGWPRRLARLYLTGGLSTLLLGLAVGLSWAGLLPLAMVLESLGIGEAGVVAFVRGSSLLFVGLVAFMLAWGFTGGQMRIERSRVRIGVRDLHDAHHGLRIAHLSDLHIGNGMEGERLSRLVGEVNALDADLIAMTGDLFDFDPGFVEDGARRLGELRARLGVFAVLGNHDTYTGSELVASCLAEHAPGLRLLRGDVEPLAVEPPLYVAGVDDPGRDWTAQGMQLDSLEQLGAALPSDGPSLLLVHRPEAFPQAARLGFPLVLAGHTHGGQLALPTPGGRYNLARIVTRFHRGLYRENGSVLYVNRGIGVAGPAIRFNCTREIAMIELSGSGA